jgi:hypothetical protein
MRHYKCAKELWLQLETFYQNETLEEEKSSQSEEQDSEKENYNQIEEHNTLKDTSNKKKMKDLIQSLVINEEDNLINELRHTSIITKEKLHNLKTDVIVAI